MVCAGCRGRSGRPEIFASGVKYSTSGVVEVAGAALRRLRRQLCCRLLGQVPEEQDSYVSVSIRARAAAGEVFDAAAREFLRACGATTI